MSDDPESAPKPGDPIDLVGHDTAENTFLESWNAGRMPHAWLITGPRGIGKASLAYRIARFVLSQGAEDTGDSLFGDALPPVTPETLAIDADHPVSTRIAAGGHADLRVLEPGMLHPDTGKPTQQIVVSQVRKAVQFTGLTSAEEGWRIVLVDPADELNPNAQNAILKVLEEPPAMVLFLLVCNAPGRLLPTIRSRCRRLPLGALDTDTVVDLLSRYQPAMDPADRLALATLTEGSIGDAIALSESGGLDLYRAMLRLLDGLDNPDIQAIHALGDTVARAGQGAAAFATLRRLIGRWLGQLVLSGARRQEAPEVVPGEAQIAARLRARASLEQWLEVWEKVVRLLDQADRANLDRKHTVVSAFLTLAAVLKPGPGQAR